MKPYSKALANEFSLIYCLLGYTYYYTTNVKISQMLCSETISDLQLFMITIIFHGRNDVVQ
jgi:hypothetical protein